MVAPTAPMRAATRSPASSAMTPFTAVAYVRDAYSAASALRDCGDGGFGLAASLVQEETDGEEHRRAGERERDARLDADPSAVDGDDEEEDDADDDRQPAEPGEDPAAEQILERSLAASAASRARGRPAPSAETPSPRTKAVASG